MLHCVRFSVTLLLIFGYSAPSGAQDDRDRAQDLKKLTIEELARLDVTSVSRRPEPLSNAAAAVSVLRQQDIERSGPTSLAEALRLGDGVDVGRPNATTWGISTRGFNISTANKLLVLVDGRSTYVPLFGGTFWDVQDTILGDLDRIEIIRGPGGSLWGANAVNGVINIISRPAAETQGTIGTLMAGASERVVASARYGGRAGANYYRVYGKYRQRGPNLLASGGSARNDLEFGQGGFRIESPSTVRTAWMISGLAYRGSMRFPDRDDGSTAGGHVMARVHHATERWGQFQLQTYYDRSFRRIPLQFTGTRDTVDFDVQQAFRTGRHNLVAGSTVRVSDARDRGISGFVFDPERRTSWTFNAFIHEEFELSPARAYLIAGTKFGRNNYTGLEFQPNVRVRFHPAERQVAWAAVSRAVRLPTRFDTDLRLVQPDTGRVTLSGSDDFEAESVIAVEGGYRILPHPRVSLDVALFSNRYDELRSQELRFTPSPVVVLANELNARTGGIELASTVQPMDRWRIHGSYTWFRKSLSLDSGSTDFRGGIDEGNDPAHQVSVRSYVDLPLRVAFDAVLRHVGERPTPVIQAFTELDLRVGWTARPGWDLSLIGQNLLHGSHAELNYGGPRELIRRAVFVRSIWRF